MSKQLTVSIEQGMQSNYHITVQVSKSDYESYKNKALLEFAKTYKKDGFRPGKVPLEMVKQEVNELYLEMDAMNDIINGSLDQILKNHADKKFIGQPYDFDKKTNGDDSTFTYTLDVYPEVVVKNDNRKSARVEAIDNNLSDAELEEALNSLKHQYATYVDTDAISHHTVDRIKIIYMNNEGEEIHTKTLFIDHADKHDGGFHNLEGKTVGEIIQVPYQDVPEKLIYSKDDKIPTTITIEVLRTQTEQLPSFDEENIQTLFGNEGITNREQLKERIAAVMKEQKHQHSLMDHVDAFVTAIQASFDIQVPKTMIESEFDNRYKHMTERVGGKEKFEQAYLGLPKGKEELEKKKQELRDISKLSLVKFFALQKVAELLGIHDIARDKDLEAEKKLYDHFNAA